MLSREDILNDASVQEILKRAYLNIAQADMMLLEFMDGGYLRSLMDKSGEIEQIPYMFENHLLAIILIYAQAFRCSAPTLGINQILEGLFAGLDQNQKALHAYMLSIANHRLNITEKTHDMLIERNIEEAGSCRSDITVIQIDPTFKLLIRQGMLNLDFIEKFQVVTERLYKEITPYLAANMPWRNDDELAEGQNTGWGRRKTKTALYIPLEKAS